MTRRARIWLGCFVLLFVLSGAEPGQTPRGFRPTPEISITVNSILATPNFNKGAANSFGSWQGDVLFTPDLQGQELLTLINNHRTGRGARPLAWHTGLTEGAISFTYILKTNLNTVANGCAIQPATNCGNWDIPGLLSAALPQINFTDIGQIITFDPTGIGNASVFYYTDIASQQLALNIIQDPRFTHMGAFFNPIYGTWIVILGQNVTPQ